MIEENILSRFIDKGIYPTTILLEYPDVKVIIDHFYCDYNYHEKVCVAHYNARNGDQKRCIIYW